MGHWRSLGVMLLVLAGLAVWINTADGGIVGYWTFEGDTQDQVNANHGTQSGSGTGFFSPDTPGALTGSGQSLSLNGGQYVEIANEQNFDLGASITVSTWVKGALPGTWDPFISKNGEPNGWQFRRHGGDQTIDWTTRRTPNNDVTDFASIRTDVGNGDWHHIAATFDGTQKRIYIDGRLDNYVLVPYSPISDSPQAVVFGGRLNPGLGNTSFEGLMDEVAIYDEPLSGNQVAHLAAGGDPTALPAALADPEPPRLIAPYGPNGEWVAYERDTQSQTFDQARAAAASRTYAGAQGHLVAIGSGAENQFVYRRLGTGWIGLTDLDSVSSIDGFDYGALGTAEGGNTSGQPTPVAAVPASGQRGYGYQWVNGEPLTHSRWNGGEPNDAGGEDAIEIVDSLHGAWNDLPAGSTAGQADGFNRMGTIEYNLGVRDLKGLAVPGLLATVYKATEGNMRAPDDNYGLRHADSLIGSTGDPGRILGSAPLSHLDLVDPDSSAGGDYAFNIEFPGTGDGANGPNGTDENQATAQVTGTLNVAADGTFVFQYRGDDGGRLRIDGQDIIVDDAWHGHSGPDSAPVFLSAGAHRFELVGLEATGGWSAELGYDNLDVGGGAVVVGDSSQGISADMVVTTYKLSGNVDINNLADSEQLIAGQLQRGEGTPVKGITSVIDMGGGGLYPHNFSYLGIGGDDFVLEATGWVNIPIPGQYTFGVNSDDGFGLTIDGAELVSATDETGSILGVDGLLAYNANRGMGTPTLGVFDFDEPGFYFLRLVQWERGGGEGAELFAAPGAFTAFDADAFRLVGDYGNGGLFAITNVPEPATYLLLALGGLGLFVWRRRRTRL